MVSSVPCALCGGDGRRLFSKYGHWVAACTSCGHRYADLSVPADHARRVYSDGYFSDGGAGYADYIAEGRLIRQHGRRYATILARYMEPGKVLDVGAAAGFLLQGLKDRGWEGVGLEPNASMVAYAREQFGLRAVIGTIETVTLEETFDLVSMIQVVAHFPDPVTAFEAAAELTGPGGHWLIETWDRTSWTARLFGRWWHEYSPPSVLHWFSAEAVRELAGRFGFETIARGRPEKRLNGAHLKSLLRYKVGEGYLARIVSSVLGLVPDSVSLRYPCEDLFWLLLRRR